MGYQETPVPDQPSQPDLDVILAQAWSNTKPIPLDQARTLLGHRFNEAILARETLIIGQNGTQLMLAPSTWIKIITRLKDMECGRTAAVSSGTAAGRFRQLRSHAITPVAPPAPCC